MIILDTEEKQQLKHPSDPIFDGPTIRFPEKAVARSDPPLPDYETSEAHQKLMTREISSHRGIDPKLWRAVIYAFAIYVMLSVIIGVPIIVVNQKKKQNNVPINYGFSWDDDDSSTSISLSNPDVWALDDSAKCKWDDIDTQNSPLHTAQVQHTLNYSGSFYIRSNISSVASSPSHSSGDFMVDLNPDTKALDVAFAVSVKASSSELLLHTSACFTETGNDRGLFVFVSRQLEDTDYLTVNVKMLLPNTGHSVTLDNFVTCLPWFSHNFGDLKNHLTIKNLVLEGARYDVVADSLKAANLTIRNSYASIIGNFHATSSLTLDGIKGNIETNITLEKLSSTFGPTSLILDTGDGSIDANVSLVAPPFRFSPNLPPFAFIADIKTFNGPVKVSACNANSTPPIPIQLTVQNTDGKTDVYVDKNYQGTYSVQSKLGNVTVVKPFLPASMDPLGLRRQRVYQTQQQQSPNMRAGWVGWGKPVTSGDGSMQGQMKITTSLSPIILHLGSASDSG